MYSFRDNTKPGLYFSMHFFWTKIGLKTKFSMENVPVTSTNPGTNIMDFKGENVGFLCLHIAPINKIAANSFENNTLKHHLD